MRTIHLLLQTLAFTLYMANAQAAERTIYFVPDAQGSPVAAMDAAGNLLWRETYAPYGARQTRASDNAASPAFTGKPEDTDTGLVYMGARWYDPETARFTGVDPIGFALGNPQSFGRYLYANNSPYMFLDPNGEAPTPLDALLLAYDAGAWAMAMYSGNPVAIAEASADLGMSVAGLALPVPGGALVLKAGRAAEGADDVGKVVPIPERLARVIGGDVTPSTLGRPGDPDVFVTGADEISGLDAKGIATKLTIPERREYTVYEFPTSEASGLASPLNRSNPGFVQGGKTAGGATEFVVDNGPIPSNSTRRVVR